VQISKALREKYPEEMTIVLQHQFDDLHVTDDFFSVVLSFDNVREKIQIPFDSLIAFADPSVKFGLQFSHTEKKPVAPEDTKAEKPGKKTKGKTSKDALSNAANNVVDIDAFRKK
jgi:hypothetical protein